MSEIKLTIDNQEITATEGEKLLWVALENDIYIPNLCAIKEQERPAASCRLCFVEVEGYSEPVTSCTLPVKEGMKVQTRTPAVDRLVKSAFELLLSDHKIDCGKCPARKSCELINIAKQRGMKLKLERLPALEREQEIDDSSEYLTLDRNKCVLCGRCVWADREKAQAGCFGFARRGLNRSVTTFQDISLAEANCTGCKLCAEVCPVGALVAKEPAES